MSRADALGLFWQDVTKIKVKKEKVKKTPPARTWEEPDYLPGLEEACRFNVPIITDEELYTAVYSQDELLFDIEVYPNYFLFGFKSRRTGKIGFLERCDTLGWNLDYAKLKWILTNACLVGFNSRSYDLPLATLAAAGASNERIKEMSDLIIVQNARAYEILRMNKLKQLECNHIDLIEVAPLRASLKAYAGRFHARRMQDLPFRPDVVLSPDQITITRWYNVNDLDNTGGLREHLSEQIDLRVRMSAEYGVDLRSKSDAQIAETVIGRAIEGLTGQRSYAPEIEPGTRYNYQDPGYLNYKSALMRHVKELVLCAPFVVADHGAIGMPEVLQDLKITIADATYTMGIGGLHSTEESVAHVANEEYCIVDRDVASYYPRIILNQGLYPGHIGPTFLDVYNSIVERRLGCKRDGDKVSADTLKIVINGTFGKLSNMFSDMYSPNLGIQVTVSGQLTLLLLIERLEWEGIHVISANTDGITIKCRRSQRARMNEIIAEWERDTRFETEEVEYRALYSRDVNNYIALKLGGGYKGKGVFANPWGNKKEHAFELHKNPQTTICIEAVVAHLESGVPLEQTILTCNDIRKFVSVRSVTGGAVKDGEYLGKQIRWYYSKNCPGAIIYAKSGNNVPKSEGAKPLMLLPDALPEDVDHEWYLREAREILIDIGAVPKPPKEKVAKSK